MIFWVRQKSALKFRLAKSSCLLMTTGQIEVEVIGVTQVAGVADSKSTIWSETESASLQLKINMNGPRKDSKRTIMCSDQSSFKWSCQSCHFQASKRSTFCRMNLGTKAGKFLKRSLKWHHVDPFTHPMTSFMSTITKSLPRTWVSLGQINITIKSMVGPKR